MRRTFSSGGRWARTIAVLAITVLAISQAAATALAGGVAYSFGANTEGFTGQDTTVGSTTVATSIDVTNLAGKTIRQVSAGLEHSLVLTDDGTVYSFGHPGLGLLGLGPDIPEPITVATPIDTTNLGARKIKQISAGDEHSLILAEDGTVFAFGDNMHGQLGLGESVLDAPIATPIVADSLTGKTIVQVSAGARFSLLLADDGSVFAFGDNLYGQTGLGELEGYTYVPTALDMSIFDEITVTQVAAGFQHSLLLTDVGLVFSCGANEFGMAGQGINSDYTLTPTLIDMTNLEISPDEYTVITQVSVALAPGGWDGAHNLLLAEDGTVYSFGSNEFGQAGLGEGVEGPFVATPIDNQYQESPFVQVAAGVQHSLLLAEDGTVFSFGANGDGDYGGMTGLGTIEGLQWIAVSIDESYLGGMRTTSISAGGAHSLLVAVPVPEPGGATLVLLAAVSLLLGRRRR